MNYITDKSLKKLHRLELINRGIWKCSKGRLAKMSDMNIKHIERAIEYCFRRNDGDSAIELMNEKIRRIEELRKINKQLTIEMNTETSKSQPEDAPIQAEQLIAESAELAKSRQSEHRKVVNASQKYNVGDKVGYYTITSWKRSGIGITYTGNCVCGKNRIKIRQSHLDGGKRSCGCMRYKPYSIFSKTDTPIVNPVKLRYKVGDELYRGNIITRFMTGKNGSGYKFEITTPDGRVYEKIQANLGQVYAHNKVPTKKTPEAKDKKTEVVNSISIPTPIVAEPTKRLSFKEKIMKIVEIWKL